MAGLAYGAVRQRFVDFFSFLNISAPRKIRAIANQNAALSQLRV